MVREAQYSMLNAVLYMLVDQAACHSLPSVIGTSVLVQSLYTQKTATNPFPEVYSMS
jgi:hypothetical protein